MELRSSYKEKNETEGELDTEFNIRYEDGKTEVRRDHTMRGLLVKLA